MSESHERRQTSHTIRNIIISLIIIVIAAVISTGTLIFFRQTALPKAAVNAAAVMGAFTQQAGNGSLLNGDKTVADTSAQPIYVKNPTNNAYLLVTTTKNVSIINAQGFTRNQVVDIKTSMQKFLDGQGLASVTLPDNNLHTILLGYANNNVSCQLQEVPGADALTTIRFSCANGSDYSDEAATINQLLSAWKNEQTTQYAILSVDIQKNDTYSVAVLNAMPTDTSSHYIVFVKDAEKWNYIGDASIGKPVIANEKYVINSDIQTALENPGYGSFLHSILFATTKK